MDQAFDETAVWQRVTATREEKQISPLYSGLEKALGDTYARLHTYQQLRRRDAAFPSKLIPLCSRELTLLRGIYIYLSGSPAQKPQRASNQPRPQITTLMAGLDQSARQLGTLSELAQGESRQIIMEICALEQQQFHLLLETLGSR